VIAEPLPSVILDLYGPRHQFVGTVALACKPGQLHWHLLALLVDERGADKADPVQAQVQVLEDVEYRYELQLDAAGSLKLEPSETFDPDNDDGRTGRFRPGRHTGTLEIQVLNTAGQVLGTTELEVRARKLHYESEYRWMLGRLSEEAAELVMHRFGAAGQTFRPESFGSPQTIYQRFAFLASLLDTAEFDAALQVIHHRPHVEHHTITYNVHPSHGLRASRALMQSLTGPGHRFQLPAGRRFKGMGSLPSKVKKVEHVETIDTVPNRFVKYVLEYWRDLTENIERALGGIEGPASRRGSREARELSDRLHAYLAAPMFGDVGNLTQFPASNQVLQRREGYRDVFRAFLLTEVAASIDWHGGIDVFRAGQRDVATLYEYWVFLELARILSDVLGQPVDRSKLFQTIDGKLSLELRRGRQLAVAGETWRYGRRLLVELWFNRTFGRPQSWTETVRPDCSIKITPERGIEADQSTWLHFDAKYRVQNLEEIMGKEIGEENLEEESASGLPAATDALPEDLLKMHAYRDAVRRTSGAFVLYPGSDHQRKPLRQKYHELVPGLGAFVLRPTETGYAASAGASSLRTFIDQVLNHVAAQGTSQERADFWEQRSYKGQRARQLPASTLLRRPPADTVVLIGYIRSPVHLDWVTREHLYNLRADGRSGSVGLDSPELSAEFLVLWNRAFDRPFVWRTAGSFVLRTGNDLASSGYPDPRGDLYCCMALAEEVPLEMYPPLSTVRVLQARTNRLRSHAQYAPATVTWAELFDQSNA
jgi:predicted component of viral defense system (DUF524 family)